MLIEKWSQLQPSYLKSLINFIEDNKNLSKRIERSNSKNSKIGFNVFQIVSDSYYKENFHSYLLLKLLSQSYHKDGNIFFDLFLNCLNLIAKNKIDLQDFKAPIIEGEKDKIDIRIRDYNSMKSIIIENKMNDARDQPRQIPRYYKNEVDNKFTVVGIVYLTLTKGKRPDKTGWNIKEKKIIDELIIYLDSSVNSEVNLIQHWIDLCINTSNNIDVISTLRQYKEILKYLRLKEMNQEFLNLFYNQILEKGNYSAALSIRDLLIDLNEYRAIKIKEDFYLKAIVFNKIHHFKYDGDYRAKFESPKFKNIDFWIDIVCIEKKTLVYLHEANTFVENNDKIQKILLEFDELKNFKQVLSNSYCREFSFPEEEKKLYAFLESILEKLKGLDEKIFIN